MRLMAFSLTTDQIRGRTKTVTRRLGWSDLRPGELLQAVEKSMGLKKGERVRRLAVLRARHVWREPLRAATGAAIDEARLEGFPHLTTEEFIAFFCRSHRGCTWDTVVTRIEFGYVKVAKRFGRVVDAETGEVLR
jgi:hypothetical protein